MSKFVADILKKALKNDCSYNFNSNNKEKDIHYIYHSILNKITNFQCQNFENIFYWQNVSFCYFLKCHTICQDLWFKLRSKVSFSDSVLRLKGITTFKVSFSI